MIQGSPEWHAARLGKATASRIADIVRRTKSGESASRQRYLGELVAERLTGRASDSYKSADMEWGSQTEAEAREVYGLYIGAAIETVGFIPHPKIDMSGASPDGLVGNDGLVEIKCPATHTHVVTLLNGKIADDYLIQMQWQMACTGRSWCDFVSYDPRMPDEMRLFVSRVIRDDRLISELEQSVVQFLDDVSETVRRLTDRYALKTEAA